MGVSIPYFGINPDIVNPLVRGNTTGLWISDTQQHIAMLAFYFLALVLPRVYYFFSLVIE